MKSKFLSAVFVFIFCYTSQVLAQVPILSSNPGAPGTIFLDFDGHLVSGTPWNGASDILCAGSGLTDAQIQETFDRVAEDYRPFNVNITTDSTVFLQTNVYRRMRVIVTTTSDWYPGVGGVSFVGSFTYGDDTPCFVFSGALNYRAKYVAEAASHEAGHTLGLFHQAVYDQNCALVASYNAGTGAGEIGWAPIMGVGYSKNFTLWNNGPNPYGCDQLQNDLEIITSYNGFGYRQDDYANTFATAVNNPFVNNQFTVNGIIEQNTDKDVFKFTVPALGRFKLDAIPYNVGVGNSGSDLDLQVTLYKGDQTQLNMYNPGTTLSLVVDTLLEPGDYYAKIEGRGNAYASAYASLGSYSLQASFTDESVPLPLRKLELKGILKGADHELNWLIDADEKVTAQTLEISTDGRNFSTLTAPDASARTYRYLPTTGATLLYRIKVNFDNGREYYSNTISIRETGPRNYKPQITGNMIRDPYLLVSSPGNYTFLVMDLTGKFIAKGTISNGTNRINTATLSAGMYLISFTNGTAQYTEKFIRQ